MSSLRPYQSDLIFNVYDRWDGGNKNVCMVLPTGGGKTKCLSRIVLDSAVRTLIVAHRHEIVSQLSLALAREGISHDVFVSRASRKLIAESHAIAFDRIWLNPVSDVRVASAQTLVSRLDEHRRWLRGVKLWVVDEAHHVTRNSTWGKIIDTLPENARGLGPTAIPERLDGKGIGRNADGYMDTMVVGPSTRWLIDNGYLSDYDIACVDSHLRDYLGAVAKSGDWSQAKLSDASRHSQIVGDVAESYYRFAFGKRGLTFTTDVETAQQMAEHYTSVGIEADILTGKTPPHIRSRRVRALEEGRLRQLVAVDVVSEGFDLPAVDVVTLARPSKSLNLVMQQIGRGLRPSPGKDRLMIIDHVGNILDPAIGLPDKPRQWSLDRRSDRQRQEANPIPLHVCLECARPYEAFLKVCPYCGAPKPKPVARSSPEQVAGVLSLLDPEVLAQMRGDVAKANMPIGEYRDWLANEKRMPGIVVERKAREHWERSNARSSLKNAMDRWAGQSAGLSRDEIEAKFFYSFGISGLEALALNKADAEKLQKRIEFDVPV